MPLALSTGHEVGLGVTALVFIAFALASSLLLPRFRPNYPGRGLPAFIVISFVFFFGMLTAVENFGGESKHGEAAAAESTTAETTTAAQTTTAETTTQAATTTATTTTAAKPVATKVQVSETEFKITTDLTSFKAGQITFHDLAVKETGDKTKEIPPGGTAELKVNLKPGKYELYCTIPGHEAAGMKLTITVS